MPDTPTTYVLVPGAASDSWYWHLVAADLTSRGHHVIAVDLPCDDDTAGLDRYAETTLTAIDGRHDLILVAQSFGAFTAPLICADASVQMLVLVAPMVPAPGETPGEWWANTGQPEAKASYAHRHGQEDTDDPGVVFLNDVPTKLAAEALRRTRDQSARPFEDPWPLRTWPDVPTRVLIGRDDRFFPPDFQHRIVRARIGIEPDEIDGGHLLALARPHQLSERLEKYRSILAT